MTHGTESSTRLDDHDPRDPAYADDVREEAYHAGDEPDRDTDTDTELDAAARPDATDTVDDEAREGDWAVRERSEEARDAAHDARDAAEDARDAAGETRADEMHQDHDGETRVDEMRGDHEAFDGETRVDEMRHDHDETPEGDEVGRGGDPFGVDEANRERDAFQEDEADYEAGSEGTSARESASEAGDVHSPTAVATAPVNAMVPEQRSADGTGAHEAGTDRDAVDAVEAESAPGTLYRTGTDTAPGAENEADDQSVDNGPIVAGEATSVHDEMKPGSVEPAPVAAFWNEADAQGIRDRWRELQLRFIDDPETVAGEAERLVEEAVAGLTAALSRAKQELGDWRDGQSGDTERLRAAVRSYRDFLDRLLGL